MTNLVPVVLFTHKRLATAKRVIDSLRDNKEAERTELIIYSDGPKTINDIGKVEDVRRYIGGLTGFKSIELIYRDKNLGLAESFIQGITEILTRYEKAIFLEDDNLLSKHFLSFMNRALHYYKDSEKVICVTGYSWPLRPASDRPYFLRGAETWSMGTWRRGWRHFCADGKSLLSDLQMKGLVESFRSDGFGFYEMLQRHVRGEIDSWGVRWWASAYVKDMYCLYPHKPLCVTIGYGEDSVHCRGYSPLFRRPAELSKDPVIELPDDITERISVRCAIRLMNKMLSVRQRLLAIYNRVSAIFLMRQ